MVARSNVCRTWILYKYGGMWLDLQGTPSKDPHGIGLETVPRFFNGPLPPLLFQYGGDWKKELNLKKKKYGEIMNGFMMSRDHHPVWRDVLSLQVKMLRSYPQRWQQGVQKTRENKLQKFEKEATFFSRPMSMVGREGVLCMGPLAMTKIVYKHLSKEHALETCVPKDFNGFWNWSSHKTRKRTYKRRQAELLYWDSEKQAAHTHYSDKTTPIVHVV